MNSDNDEGTYATGPTGWLTDLGSTVGSANTSSLQPPVPPASGSGVGNGDLHYNGLETGVITSYVVPIAPQEPDEEIIDAINIIPEFKIIEEEKKKKRICVIRTMVLFVVTNIVVIAIVFGLTAKEEASNGDSDSASSIEGNTSIIEGNITFTLSPSQSPSTSPTSSVFVELLSEIEFFYDGSDEFSTIFSNESSPQYRAASWVAESASISEVDGDKNRMISRFALATFYFSTNGDDWLRCDRESTLCQKSEEWLTAPNECDWYAIECHDDEPSIAKIFFPPNGGVSNHVTGTLPSEVSFLSKLAMFIIPKGPISGPFPDWSNLSSLEYIALNNHQFTGEFPDYLIRENPLLSKMYFANNRFEGHFMKEDLSIDSTMLKDLRLDGNSFTGSISSQIGKFSSLLTLNIGDNGFTGTIPSELYTLTELRKLNMSSTKIYGEISPSFGNLSRLLSFEAAHTELDGTLPIELFSLYELQRLDLSFGKFDGSLPELFSNLKDLETVILHNNGFTGTIPDGFEEIPDLATLLLHSNDLSGSVPEELCFSNRSMKNLTIDCLKVYCSCCTNCLELR